VWDKKRQSIWIISAVIIATFVVFQEARDDAGRFDLAYFAQLEIIFLLVIAVMFYIYSRQKR
jgi:hypothetical protein